MKLRCLNCMKEYEEGNVCPFCGFEEGTPPKEIYHLYPGVVLADRYIIGTVVASGGFGVLYRAWDQKLEIMVAVKEYFPSSYVNRNPGEKEIFVYTSKQQGQFQAGLEGFLEEAKSTAKFSSCPNIVNVYDYFKENGTAYMVMEYMEGITLKEYTKNQGGRLPWDAAVHIVSRISTDLETVHREGILHRDIKPENIMICTSGAVKLFDFGAARFSDEENDRTREVILTIGFAPPEQYRKKSRQGPWTDVYALGATLYWLITGKTPEEAEDRKQSVEQKKRDSLQAPKELVPEIPDYLNTAILRAMAIQPQLRFQTAGQFQDAILHKKEYLELERELKRRLRLRKMGIGGLVFLLAASGIGCLSYYKKNQDLASLNGAYITLWAAAEPGEEENKKSCLEQMLEEFQADYPLAQVQVTVWPKEQYDTELQKAEEMGTGPALYEIPEEESIHLEKGESGNREDLRPVLELLEPQDYYGLDEAFLQTGPVSVLPLGIRAGAAYTNTLVEAYPEQNSREAYFEEASGFFVGDTGDYPAVQEAFPGIYSVEEMDATPAAWDEIWAVDRRQEELDKEGARKVLYYFLSEAAQDIMHVQNAQSLPVNKKELEAYLELNTELSFLESVFHQGQAQWMENGETFQAALDEGYKIMTERGR